MTATAQARKDERDARAQKKVDAAAVKQQRESTAAKGAAQRLDTMKHKRSAELEKERPPVGVKGKKVSRFQWLYTLPYQH